MAAFDTSFNFGASQNLSGRGSKTGRGKKKAVKVINRFSKAVKAAGGKKQGGRTSSGRVGSYKG